MSSTGSGFPLTSKSTTQQLAYIITRHNTQKTANVYNRETKQTSVKTINPKMGNSESKDQDVKQIGDQQVTVIENQEVHTEMHGQHEWKLWLIVGLQIFMVIMMLIKTAKKKCKKELAKSMANIHNI